MKKCKSPGHNLWPVVTRWQEVMILTPTWKLLCTYWQYAAEKVNVYLYPFSFISPLNHACRWSSGYDDFYMWIFILQCISIVQAKYSSTSILIYFIVHTALCKIAGKISQRSTRQTWIMICACRKILRKTDHIHGELSNQGSKSLGQQCLIFITPSCDLSLICLAVVFICSVLHLLTLQV